MSTGNADVGALAGMGAHVSRQVAGRREGMSTGDAYVGALAGMGAHVRFQGVGFREGVATCCAWVGAVASMGAHVTREVALRQTRLPADRALDKVDLLPRPALASFARHRAFASRIFATRLFPSPLAPDHRQVRLAPDCLGRICNFQFWSK